MFLPPLRACLGSRGITHLARNIYRVIIQSRGFHVQGSFQEDTRWVMGPTLSSIPRFLHLCSYTTCARLLAEFYARTKFSTCCVMLDPPDERDASLWLMCLADVGHSAFSPSPSKTKADKQYIILSSLLDRLEISQFPLRMPSTTAFHRMDTLHAGQCSSASCKRESPHHRSPLQMIHPF